MGRTGHLTPGWTMLISPGFKFNLYQQRCVAVYQPQLTSTKNTQTHSHQHMFS